VTCASLVRQFEFAQNVWINDLNFHELRSEHDPIIGAQDGTFDFTISKRPIRRTIKGLPTFTTMKGDAYFFVPGIRALHYLANLSEKELIQYINKRHPHDERISAGSNNRAPVLLP
jgi:hypothetical protein